MSFRQTAALVMALLVVVPLTGCSAAAEADVPEGVSVSVHQNRPDTADRRLQVRVANNSPVALTITRLTFSSPQFAEAVSYPKAPTMITVGGVTDLPVSLAAPACGTERSTPTVAIDFSMADGRTGHASVVPSDPLTQLPEISARDCLDEAVAEIATIREPAALRVQERSGRLVAFLDLIVTPTGASGSIRIDSVDDTVLLGLFESSQPAPVPSLPIGLDVRGTDGPQVITVPLVPARCDAHAVAEDKRGTLLPLHLEAGGLSGISYFALSAELAGTLYAFVSSACAMRR